MKKLESFGMFGSSQGRHSNSNNINSKMYSKDIPFFKAVDVRLLRSIDDMEKEYTGEGIDDEYYDDSNIEAGEICQLTQTPDGRYSVGRYGKNGSGTTFYMPGGNRKFIEGVDFEFV
jgi:hypothetical protein